MNRYTCLVYGPRVHPAVEPLHLRTLIVEADAPDTAGVRAFEQYDTDRARHRGCAVESLAAHSVTVLPTKRGD